MRLSNRIIFPLNNEKSTMRLKEYRIPIPLILDEYQLGKQGIEIQLIKEILQICSTYFTIYEHTTEQECSDIINGKKNTLSNKT